MPRATLQALLLGYGVLLVAVGLWVSRRVRGSGGFFVADRSLSAGLLFVTLLAANIGAGSTVGATGLGYRFGWGAWWWSGSAALGCVLLGAWVAPRLHVLAQRERFLTVGDYLEWRYDRGLRGLMAAVLALATLLILAGQLIAMAWALEIVAGIPKVWGCCLAGVVLVGYFAGGGLLASAWVNLVQLIVLLAGFALALPFAWQAAGGSVALNAADARLDIGSGVGLPWPMLLGFWLTLLPSFVISPGLLQKTYGARNTRAVRWGVWTNAVALALFALVPPLLGLAARVLRPDLANPELALPLLLADALPPAVGALGLAALFAAEISTADAVLFMLVTSLSQDVYKSCLHREASDAQVLRVARITACVCGLVGVLLAAVTPSVVDALKGFYGILTVALAAPLLLGLASPRPGARQAKLAVVLALSVLALARQALAGRPAAAWLPYAAALASAGLTMGTAWLRPGPVPQGR